MITRMFEYVLCCKNFSPVLSLDMTTNNTITDTNLKLTLILLLLLLLLLLIITIVCVCNKTNPLMNCLENIMYLLETFAAPVILGDTAVCRCIRFVPCLYFLAPPRYFRLTAPKIHSPSPKPVTFQAKSSLTWQIGLAVKTHCDVIVGQEDES